MGILCICTDSVQLWYVIILRVIYDTRGCVSQQDYVSIS